MSNNKYFKDKLSLRLKNDELVDHSPSLENVPSGIDFKLYTMDLSYFCGKLEMYMRYKEIPFQKIEPHGEEFESILCKNTGSEQLPQLFDCRKHTDDKCRWLRDTTYIIEYLESNPSITSLPVIPKCTIQKFFHKLFEDYADEYLWRPAMFWRWEPEFDNKVMGLRFTYEFARTSQSRFKWIPNICKPYLLSLRQWLLSSYGEDCNTEEKKNIVINQYYELLEIMEEILSNQPYLFGNIPTLIDFAFAGPFYRHFSSDFTPRKVMQNFAPNVYEWIARLWNCKSSKMKNINPDFPSDGQLPASWDKLLQLLPDYFDYYLLNYQSFHLNKSSFEWINKCQCFKVPVVPYRAWCKQELSMLFNCLDESDKKTVVDILANKAKINKTTIDQFFQLDKPDILPECGISPPLSLPNKKTGSVLSYKWDPTNIYVSYFSKIISKSLLVATFGFTSFKIYRLFKK